MFRFSFLARIVSCLLFVGLFGINKEIEPILIYDIYKSSVRDGRDFVRIINYRIKTLHGDLFVFTRSNTRTGFYLFKGNVIRIIIFNETNNTREAIYLVSCCFTFVAWISILSGSIRCKYRL